MTRAVLASASLARGDLVRQVGMRLSHSEQSTRIWVGFATPEMRAMILAFEKAKCVAARLRHGIIVGIYTAIIHSSICTGYRQFIFVML